MLRVTSPSPSLWGSGRTTDQGVDTTPKASAWSASAPFGQTTVPISGSTVAWAKNASSRSGSRTGQRCRSAWPAGRPPEPLRRRRPAGGVNRAPVRRCRVNAAGGGASRERLWVRWARSVRFSALLSRSAVRIRLGGFGVDGKGSTRMGCALVACGVLAAGLTGCGGGGDYPSSWVASDNFEATWLTWSQHGSSLQGSGLDALSPSHGGRPYDAAAVLSLTGSVDHSRITLIVAGAAGGQITLTGTITGSSLHFDARSGSFRPGSRGVRTGRRLILRLDAKWPWATELADAFERLKGLAFTT